MPRTTRISTLRKNIEKDSRAFFIKHRTHRFIEQMAKKDERPVGSFLDVVIEELARQRLSPDEFDEAVQEAEIIETQRRTEAEANLDNLSQKHQEQRQRRQADLEENHH